MRAELIGVAKFAPTSTGSVQVFNLSAAKCMMVGCPSRAFVGAG